MHPTITHRFFCRFSWPRFGDYLEVSKRSPPLPHARATKCLPFLPSLHCRVLIAVDSSTIFQYAFPCCQPGGVCCPWKDNEKTVLTATCCAHFRVHKWMSNLLQTGQEDLQTFTRTSWCVSRSQCGISAANSRTYNFELTLSFSRFCTVYAGMTSATDSLMLATQHSRSSNGMIQTKQCSRAVSPIINSDDQNPVLMRCSLRIYQYHWALGVVNLQPLGVYMPFWTQLTIDRVACPCACSPCRLSIQIH